MLREMPFDDFLAWQAFDRVSPIGDRRGDWQAASICSALFNTAAIRSGSKKRFATRDFLLEFSEDGPKVEVPVEETPVAPPWQKMKMIARMFTAQANADEDRKKPNGRRR